MRDIKRENSCENKFEHIDGPPHEENGARYITLRRTSILTSYIFRTVQRKKWKQDLAIKKKTSNCRSILSILNSFTKKVFCFLYLEVLAYLFIQMYFLLGQEVLRIYKIFGNIVKTLWRVVHLYSSKKAFFVLWLKTINLPKYITTNLVELRFVY